MPSIYIDEWLVLYKWNGHLDMVQTNSLKLNSFTIQEQHSFWNRPVYYKETNEFPTPFLT